MVSMCPKIIEKISVCNQDSLFCICIVTGLMSTVDQMVEQSSHTV